VNTVSDKVVRHSNLSAQKMVRGERPLVREILAETDQFPSKTQISNQYSLVVPQP